MNRPRRRTTSQAPSTGEPAPGVGEAAAARVAVVMEDWGGMLQGERERLGRLGRRGKS